MTGLDAIVGARELTTPADMHAFGVEIGRMLSAGDLVVLTTHRTPLLRAADPANLLAITGVTTATAQISSISGRVVLARLRPRSMA